MAASPDAVRNLVYDFHLYDLKQGWAVVQQLVKHDLDSWEKIYAAFPVADSVGRSCWSEQDEKQVAAFTRSCPFLGDKLAAQLVAEAALFVNSRIHQSFARGKLVRLGSLQERINRLYFKEKLPSTLKQNFGNGRRLHTGDNGRLVPFLEAVNHPSFLS